LGTFNYEWDTILTFDRPSYDLTLGKGKSVVVRLRPCFDGAITSVTSDCPDIAVRGRVPAMTRVPSGDHAQASFPLVGRKLHSAGTIRAKTGELEAVARVRVVQHELPSGRIELRTADRDLGLRAVWNREEHNVLEIGALHPAVAPYLGSAEEEYPGKESREYGMILAEAISEAVVYRVLQQKEKKEQEPRDQRAGKISYTDRFYSDHNRHMREILPKVQAVLVPPDPRGQVLRFETEAGRQE